LCQMCATTLGSAVLSNKNSLDTFNHARDHFRELTKRWENRFTFPSRSLIEQYQDGRFALICDLEISPRKIKTGKSGSACHDLIDNVVLASVVLHSDVVNHVDVQHWQQEPVLIDIVEIVQCPQGTIPSVVRLYDIHDEVADCFGGLMYQSAINGLYKFIPRRSKREFGVVVVAPKPSKNNLVDGVIQRGFEVVQSISDDKSEITRRRQKLCNLDFKNIVSGLGVTLNTENVKAAYRESLDFAVKIDDVLFGPFDL
jgi:hypothetical protein